MEGLGRSKELPKSCHPFTIVLTRMCPSFKAGTGFPSCCRSRTPPSLSVKFSASQVDLSIQTVLFFPQSAHTFVMS